MTDLQTINDNILTPALALLPPAFDTLNARRMLLACGDQETGFLTTVQYGNGPARSYWQDEEGGSVKGVLAHPKAGPMLLALCDHFGMVHDRHAIWQALGDPALQVFAAAFNRLLLLCDAHPMPSTRADGLDCYLNRCWRPGKPHPEKWPGCWARASAALGIAA